MTALAPILSSLLVAAAMQSGAPADPAAEPLRRAAEFVAQQHLEQANQVLTDYLHRDPSSRSALLALGRIQLQQQLNEDALRSFEAVLAADPAAPEARDGEVAAAVAAAAAEQKIGLDGDALLFLVRARKLVPDAPQLLFALGMQEERMRIYGDAETALARAHQLAPQDLRILYALAHVQLDQQKMPEAEANLRAYLEREPADATAHYGLGLLLHLSLRNDEAKAEFARSLELQPRQTASYFQLGEMAREASDDAQARGFYDQVLALAPHHGGALTGQGILALRAKDYALAESSLEQAVRYAPDSVTAHRYLAVVLARQGRADDAKREADRATALNQQQVRAQRGSFLTVIE